MAFTERHVSGEALHHMLRPSTVDAQSRAAATATARIDITPDCWNDLQRILRMGTNAHMRVNSMLPMGRLREVPGYENASILAFERRPVEMLLFKKRHRELRFWGCAARRVAWKPDDSDRQVDTKFYVIRGSSPSMVSALQESLGSVRRTQMLTE